MSLTLKFALLSALFFGVGGPLAKMTVNNYTMDVRLFLVVNGICSALVGILALGYKDIGSFVSTPSMGAIFLAVLTGLVMNSSYLFSNLSLSLKDGTVSVTYAITAAAPLLSILISLCFLNEANKVILLKLLIGALMIIIGVYIVTTSIKN